MKFHPRAAAHSEKKKKEKKKNATRGGLTGCDSDALLL